jgi:hypothetical protein
MVIQKEKKNLSYRVCVIGSSIHSKFQDDFKIDASYSHTLTDLLIQILS